MKKEFNLSEKKCIVQGVQIEGAYEEKDVKEFIKKVEEDINNKRSEDLHDRYIVGIEAGLTLAMQIIKKRAGDKLTK